MKLTTQLLSLGAQLRIIEWSPAGSILDIAAVPFQEKPPNKAFGIFPKDLFLDNCVAFAKGRQIVHLTFLITSQSPENCKILLSGFPGNKPHLLFWAHLVKMTLGFLKPPTLLTTPQKLIEKYLLVHILSIKTESQDQEPSPEKAVFKNPVQISYPQHVEAKEPAQEDEKKGLEKIHNRPSVKLIEKIFKQTPQELIEKGSGQKEISPLIAPLKIDIPFGMVLPFTSNRKNESYSEEESMDSHEESSSQKDDDDEKEKDPSK